MISYNKYINKVDHTWYDSSNVVYSSCYDSETENKALKIVFKGGRTYLYRDVAVEDYVLFKNTSSSGSGVISNITSKYKGVRLSDTSMEKLNELRESFENDNKIIEEANTNLDYVLEIEDGGNFRLILNGKTIYEGVEGHVSIVNLLNSMHISYSAKEYVVPAKTCDDFINEDIC